VASLLEYQHAAAAVAVLQVLVGLQEQAGHPCCLPFHLLLHHCLKLLLRVLLLQQQGLPVRGVD
jgi:hypothetical protein